MGYCQPRYILHSSIPAPLVTYLPSDSENYQFCFGISMKCVGADDSLESVATFFLRQHVDKQKEVIWNILITYSRFS